MATVKDNTEALMAYINKAEQSLSYAERNTFVNKAQVELYNKLCSIHEDLRQPDIQDELQREFLKLLRATTTTGRTTQSIHLAHDAFITQIQPTFSEEVTQLIEEWLNHPDYPSTERRPQLYHQYIEMYARTIRRGITITETDELMDVADENEEDSSEEEEEVAAPPSSSQKVPVALHLLESPTPNPDKGKNVEFTLPGSPKGGPSKPPSFKFKTPHATPTATNNEMTTLMEQIRDLTQAVAGIAMLSVPNRTLSLPLFKGENAEV